MLKTNMYCITIVIYLCSFYMYSYIGAIPRAVITMGMLLSTLLVIAQRKLKPNKQFLLITLGTIVPLLTFVIRNYDIQKGNGISFEDISKLEKFIPEYRVLDKNKIGSTYVYRMEKIQ